MSSIVISAESSWLNVDRAAPMNEWKIDYFSSAGMFPDWAEYGEDEWHLWPGPPTYEPLVVFRARTWLLAEAGKSIRRRSRAGRFRRSIPERWW
jgi:hypothetical protein